MTIVFSQDPTGPTPYKHEILQIGAVFSTDDLEEVHDRFGCYIRPENYDDVEDTSISFLRHSVEQVDEDVDMPPITRFIGGLVQATVDVCSYRSYMGRTPDVLEAIRETDNSVNEVREAVFDYYDVSCTRMTDAVQRANAIRHSYRALFKKLNKSSGSKKKKSKSSRRRRSTPITRGR